MGSYLGNNQSKPEPCMFLMFRWDLRQYFSEFGYINVHAPGGEIIICSPNLLMRLPCGPSHYCSRPTSPITGTLFDSFLTFPSAVSVLNLVLNSNLPIVWTIPARVMRARRNDRLNLREKDVGVKWLCDIIITAHTITRKYIFFQFLAVRKIMGITAFIDLISWQW